MSFVARQVVTIKGPQSPTWVHFGLPVPKSRLTDVRNLTLQSDGIAIPATFEVSGLWPDQSIRWLFVRAVVDKPGPLDLVLAEAGGQLPSASEPAKSEYPFDSAHDTPAIAIPDWGLTFSIDCHVIHSPNVQWQLDNHQQQSDALVASETFSFVGHGSVDIELVVTIERSLQTNQFRCLVRIHNPNAAVHPGGQWDLGDPGSMHIENLSLKIQGIGDDTTLLVQDEAGPTQSQTQFLKHPFILAQHGSGGEHWQSPIHVDANNIVPIKKRGFDLQAGAVATEGLRAKPVVGGSNEAGAFVFKPQDFWQNFPCSLRSVESGFRWDLFPSRTELQGGESKTWALAGALCVPQAPETQSSLEQLTEAALASDEAIVKYSAEYLNTCSILPHIHFSGHADKLTGLIELGLKGNSHFFAKREQTDVFGWRHYGELNADHEAANSPSADYFISHYNNQYDPLMGMILQYLFRGDPRWLNLAKPLNQHIQDIDIYDTVQDMPEYNGGLFWHTDHYLPAETCTHRSHSKYHSAAYEGFLGGGGPGGQHCYSTGLVLAYRLWGDKRAKQKVQQLCEWIKHFYDGNGSLLGRIFRFLTIDIKPGRFTNIGFKMPGYRYPLDRGTGHYLNALMDKFDVTDEMASLKDAAFVIRNTCHPKEDLTKRGFDNIEDTWFYTVFLQAVGRFLFLKESLEQIDEDYWYARHAFMHYADWMRVNERCYLDQPEKLEFPNDTWAAQDIRKANLLCFAYYFAGSERPEFLDKADAFFADIAKRLSQSEEAQYTRILVILMQNDGVRQKIQPGVRSSVPYESKTFSPVPTHSWLGVVWRFIKDMCVLASQFSFKKERACIRRFTKK